MTDLDTMKADMAVLADDIALKRYRVRQQSFCASPSDATYANALQRLHDYLSARLADAEQPAVAGDGGQSLHDAVFAALSDYRLHNIIDEDGNGYPLVDLCTTEGTSIETGELELHCAADDVCEAIAALSTSFLAGVVVPREPTSAMLNAAQDAVKAGAGMSWNGRSPQSMFAHAYQVMLDAAPPSQDPTR